MKRAASLAMVLSAAACGVEPKQQQPGGAQTGAPVQVQQPPQTAAPATEAQRDAAEAEAPAAFAVASMAKLPGCDDARDGAVVYVRAERRLLACSGRQWTDAPVESGADGLPGKDGLSGATGRDGKDGLDGRDGKDGRGAGLETDEVAPGAECAAGGVAVTPFRDDDGDGARGAEETAGETRVLCDGASGADGAAGQKGDTGAAGAAGATGAAGVQGPQGQTGPQGAAGADGTDNHIVARYVCTGAVYSNKFSAGTPTNVSGIYKAYVYASGDVRATASIYWDDAAGQPAGYSQRFSEEYAAGDGASATAVVTGKQNWVTGTVTGLWTWTLDKASSSVAVRYDDADMNPTWTTFSHVCTRTNY